VSAVAAEKKFSRPGQISFTFDGAGRATEEAEERPISHRPTQTGTDIPEAQEIRLIVRGDDFGGLLEFRSIEPRLSDDRLQSTKSNRIVAGNRDGEGALRQFFLHDNVASAAAHFLETMSCQN